MTAIKDQIIRMSNVIYKLRPTSSELLSQYNEWGFNESQIKALPDYAEQLAHVQIYKFTFFDNYSKIKLNIKH